MRFFYISLLSFGLLLSYETSAQEVKHLSLTEAITSGLENSKQIKYTLSKVRGAEASTQEMKEKRLPDFGISGQYSRLNTPSVAFNQNLFGSGEDDGSGGSSGNDSPPATPKYMMLGQASVSMPLFTGFRIKNGIVSATYLEKAAKLDAESQKGEVINNIVQAYINLYKAQAAVDIVKENLQRSQQRVKDFTNLEANGVLPKNDLLKAQLMQSNTELALLEAQNNASVANFNMDLLLGFDEDTKLDLENLGDSHLPEISSMEEWLGNAIESRNDLKAASEREKAGATGIKIAKASYYPSVALKGGYIAADIDNILTVSNAINFGLGLNFNISDIFKAKTHIRQAEEQHLQTQIAQDQLTDRIKSEVFKALTDYRQSVQRIKVYETAIAQAEENYRIVKSKHDNNLATTTELLDADVDQFQAQLNLKYAKVDAILAYTKLLQVAGQLDANSATQFTAQ